MSPRDSQIERPQPTGRPAPARPGRFGWPLLAVLLFAPAAAIAQQSPPSDAPAAAAETVAELRVLGNNRLGDETILDRVRTRVGDAYDDERLRADQQRLLETGWFDDVVIARTRTDAGIVVSIRVRERRTISAIEFLGNKNLPRKDLLEAMTFAPGAALQQYLAEKGRIDIRNAYQQEGYYFAEVGYNREAFEAGQLVYRIVEGPRVRIRKIRFEGNEHFSDFRLKWEISTQERFWPFISGFLDAEQLQRDVIQVRNLYRSEGFLDAEVGRWLRFSEDKTSVTLTFRVHEGPQYRIHDIRFAGNRIFTDEQLIGRLAIEEGDFYNAEELQTSLRRVIDAYGQMGYIEALVDQQERYRREPELIDLVFEVRENDPFRVGEIVIRGNQLTQTRVIRRKIGLFPGQLYNAVAAEKSQRRLMESRLFEQATVTPTGDDPDSRDVFVEVEEGRTAEFLVGVGVSTTDGLVGTVSVTERNFDILAWPTSWRDIAERRAFKGAGQTFSLTAEPGTELMRFYADWQEPSLFDGPYALGTRGFLWTREREEHDETRWGTVASLGRTFPNRWYVELSNRVEWVRIHNLTSSAVPEIREVTGTNLLVGLKGTLVRNRTDSRWMPSTGDLFRVSYEQVTGSFQFGKLQPEYRVYRTLYTDALDRKHILAGRLMAGQIFGDAPIFERFYGGGTGSVRGFKYRGISPRSAGRDDPIGGDFMAFAGAEYSFPLIAEFLRGVVFLDSGTVEPEFEVNTWRVATGVGLRWYIPFFGPMPLSFDFGFPLSKDEEDDTQVFSFTFGWTF